MLHNVALDELRAILAFIYQGQCVVTKEQMPGLISVAKLLKIQGLCDMKLPPTENQIDTNDSIDSRLTHAAPKTPLWRDPIDDTASFFSGKSRNL